MANPFVGEIRITPFNFAPTDWAFCDGSILSIDQNNVLFTLIGTTYGGDGQSTFALPDLRGRTPLGTQGSYIIGQQSGEEAVPLTVNQIPAHNHTVAVSTASATSPTPAKQYPAKLTAGNAYGAYANTYLAADAVHIAGTGAPHNNMQPYLTLNYIISLFGIYPSQN